jgi:hypothetical protein
MAGGTLTQRAWRVFETATDTRQARLVNVPPSQPLEFAEAHPGAVENEQRKPVAGREQRVCGKHVLRRRWLDLRLRLARQPNRDLVTRRIRRDACVIERHRERHQALADSLTLARLGELRHERRDVRGGKRVDAAIAEQLQS